MGILSWLFGGDKPSSSSGYTADQARANGIVGAALDNAAEAGLFDTRGDPQAIEDRYRQSGIDRDYSGGQRPGQQYDSWGNPVDEHGNYQGG